MKTEINYELPPAPPSEDGCTNVVMAIIIIVGIVWVLIKLMT